MSMSQPLFVFLAVLVALAMGAAIGWLLASARARAASAAARIATLQASTTLQIELSSVKEKASRVPELERDLTAALQSLNSVNERKAALETEVLRLPELENRQGQTADALAHAAASAVELRESTSRLTAELSAERHNLAALRVRLEETESRWQAKNAEATTLVVEVAKLGNSLEGGRRASQEKLQVLIDAKAALTDQFKARANEILEEKSKRFTEQNQSNLGALR